MTVPEMRDALKNVPKYRRAARWLARVDAMHPYQVTAVYFRMLEAGEFDGKNKAKR